MYYDTNFRIFLFSNGTLFKEIQYKVEDILLSTPVDFVHKGNLAEMFVGLELIKYSDCYSKGELFYWQREVQKAQAEIDYVIIRNGQLTPVEVKAGTRGSMQSMQVFLDKKNLSEGIRCALEPFSKFGRILVYPLFAVSGFCK